MRHAFTTLGSFFGAMAGQTLAGLALEAPWAHPSPQTERRRGQVPVECHRLPAMMGVGSHPTEIMTIRILSAFLFAMLLAGCSDSRNRTDQTSEETTSMSTLSGSVLYRERIALPPGATVRVTLEDSSKMDVAATVLATSVIPAEGAPPYAFELEYNAANLVEEGRYGLRAKIEADGQLLFTSTEFIPAFDETRPGPAEILVRRVGGAGSQREPGKPLASLTDTRWKVLEINGVPARLGAGQKVLHLTFTSEGVRGFAGCNNFTGSFETSGQSLTLGPLAVTNRACLDDGIQETQFLSALDRVVEYSIRGETLILKDSSARRVILCEALYL